MIALDGRHEHAHGCVRVENEGRGALGIALLVVLCDELKRASLWEAVVGEGVDSALVGAAGAKRSPSVPIFLQGLNGQVLDRG